MTGEGWGEGEKSRYFQKLFIPLPFLPSRQGRGNATFYEIINVTLKKIEKEAKEEFPNDKMMYELHVLRAVRSKYWKKRVKEGVDLQTTFQLTQT